MQCVNHATVQLPPNLRGAGGFLGALELLRIAPFELVQTSLTGAFGVGAPTQLFLQQTGTETSRSLRSGS